jgi:TolB protein
VNTAKEASVMFLRVVPVRGKTALLGTVLAITIAAASHLTSARALPGSGSAGHTIVFARGPGGGSKSDLFSMNADGTGLVRLTSTAHAANPAWSPDGREIAFDTEGKRSVINVMNADGSGIRRLVAGTRPAWSPDGRRLLFETNAGGLAVVNATGSGRHVLVKYLGVGDDSGAAWSPDGRRIAFGEQHYGGWGITLMNADGSGKRFLTNRSPNGEHFYETDPDWSPDGRQIAFTEEYDCGCEAAWPIGSGTSVGVVNTDGSGMNRYGGGFRLLTNDGSSSDPSWSPDGKRITYASGDPHQQIHVMDANGKHKLRLTTARASSFEPDWSPVR